MSDITEAVTQDAIADSLMGEPEAETQVPTGTETEPQVEVSPEPEAEAQPETEEIAEDWLPGDQDKVFPDEVYARYAQRYQLTAEQAADPLLRQLLHDKINSDILIRQQMEQEAPDFEAEAEPEPEPTQTPQPQLSREQYFQAIDQAVQARTDPEVARQFHSDFLRAFGVPEAEISKAPPQQAMQFTQVASKYMLNLVSTFLPDMLQAHLGNQLSQSFPGFSEMYERSAYAMAWDRVRNSSPEYQALPAYGSKEFSQTLRQAAARIPGFEEMQFTGRDGRPLPLAENAMRKYAMLAEIATGQNVDPQLLAQAAASGARNARRAQVTRQNGQLGSGQSQASSGRTNRSQFQTNSDLFDDETMELYKREHGRL